MTYLSKTRTLQTNMWLPHRGARGAGGWKLFLFFCVALIGAGAMPFPTEARAQSAIISSGSQTGTAGIARLDALVNQVQQRLSNVETCADKGKMFAPGADPAIADADDCLDVMSQTSTTEVTVDKIANFEGDTIFKSGTTATFEGDSVFNADSVFNSTAEFNAGLTLGMTSTCDGTTTGTLRYNAGAVEVCDGSGWNPLAGGAAGGAALAQSTGFCYGTRIGQLDNFDSACASNFTMTDSSFQVTPSGTDPIGIDPIDNTKCHRNGKFLDSSGVATSGCYVQCCTSGPTDIDNSPSKILVFVSDTKVRGDFGGVNAADAICANDAASRGYQGTYRAWLSVASDNPRNRFENWGSIKGIFNTQSRKIADNFARLNNTLLNQIGPTTNAVWTNTDPNGGTKTAVPDDRSNCRNWTVSFSTSKGNAGRANTTETNWTNHSNFSCNDQLNIYCFETAQ